MFKNNLNNFLFTFIFLLLTNEFFLFFGKFGRIISLFIGLFNIIFFLFKSNFKLSKTLFTIIIYIIVLNFISFINNQKNLTFENVIFQLLSLFLISFGKNIKSLEFDQVINESKYLFLSIFILLFLSSIKFYFVFKNISLNTFYINQSRDFGDASLNPIGIAYNHACLFLIFIWLYINSKNNFYKFLTLFSSILLLFIVFMTLSRGVIIYLTFITLFITIFKLKNHFKYSSLFYLTLFIIFSFFIIDKILFIKIRFYQLFGRIESLFDFYNNKYLDKSSIERQLNYKYFFNHYDDMFFGMYNYNSYPHNIFIEIFMRWGLFGSILFYVIVKMTKLNLKIFINERIYSFNFLVSVLFFYCFLQSLTSLSLEMNKFMWFCLGFTFLNYDKFNYKTSSF